MNQLGPFPPTQGISGSLTKVVMFLAVVGIIAIFALGVMLGVMLTSPTY